MSAPNLFYAVLYPVWLKTTRRDHCAESVAAFFLELRDRA